MAIETRIIQPDELEIAVQLLRQGECVAFPTETVYGLGANALNTKAVQKIFQVKGRPADNPLIVHIYNKEQVQELVTAYDPIVDQLMERFWPGPLSLILPKSDRVPTVVSGGLDTVAIRMPDHPVALALLEMVDLPIAAPSANLSGKPSPTRAEHVFHDLQGRIPVIIDGGPTGWGVESTVLDCTVKPFRILRPGGVTYEQLKEVVPVEVDPSVNHAVVVDQPRSPGMKYKHYAPNAKVIVVKGDHASQIINQLANSPEYQHLKRGVLAVEENLHLYPGMIVLNLGPKQEQKTIASRLYHLLRQADSIGLDVVFVEGFTDDNVGMAIMNRLRRASGNQIIQS